MNKKFLVYLLCMFILFVSFNSYAQAPPPPRVPPPGLPIDGGIVMLIAIGAIYGIKKKKK